MSDYKSRISWNQIKELDDWEQWYNMNKTEILDLIDFLQEIIDEVEDD